MIDLKSVYRNLVSFEKALELVWNKMAPVESTEKVDLDYSTGRICSADIMSPISVPPFNRSTMDGFAVRSDDLKVITGGKPVRLRIAGNVSIGDIPDGRLAPGTCMRISTGAILPEGSDAVVRVEDTRDEGEFVEIIEGVTAGENIAESGSDSVEGSLIISRSHIIQPHDVAVLASLGISQLSVYRKLSISIISTGNELIPAGSPYMEGKIYDSNSHMIAATLSTFNFVDTRYHGIVRDEWNKVEKAIKSSLDNSDIVILSGGSSAGEADLVYRIIEEMTPGIIFHGVLTKPGLPTVFGMHGSKAIIGLPGFPVSAAMILRSIFLPGIIKMAGGHYIRESQEMKLGSRLTLEIGKQNLIPARIGSSAVYPVTGLSGSISRFLETTGYLSLPGTSKFLEEGSHVSYIPWLGNNWKSPSQIYGTVDMLNIRKIRDAIPASVLSFCDPETALSMLRNGDASNIILRVAVHEDAIPGPEVLRGNPDLGAFSVSSARIVLNNGLGYVSLSDLERNDDAARISGPPLKFLERIVDKNRYEKDILSYLRRNITRYYTTNKDAKIILEIRPDLDDGTAPIISFQDIMISRLSANDLLDVIGKKFRRIW